MHSIIAIAIYTFRESIREKVLYSLFIFAAFSLWLSLALANLSIGDEVKIIKDFSLAALSLIGTLLAVFMGSGMMMKGEEHRTINVILANPVSRFQFLLGKYAGLSLIIMVEVAIIVVWIGIICFTKERSIPWVLLIAALTIWLEIQLVLALALMFSTFASQVLSGLFTLSLYMTGHLTAGFKQIADSADNTMLGLAAGFISYLLPNLEVLNYTPHVIHGIDILAGQLFFTVAYATFYTMGVLLLALYFFNRRNIG